MPSPNRVVAALRRVSAVPGAVAAVAIATLAAEARAGGGETFTFLMPVPTLDQWSYPFAADPGGNPTASIFGAWIDSDYAPQWDNRDGQMIVGFSTAAHVPPGLELSAYTIESMRLSLTVGIEMGWQYDPTQDPLSSWMLDREGKLGPDPDPGRPVELFATAFRNGYTATTFVESTPYGPSVVGKGIRHAYPIMFVDDGHVDVSNNIDAGFEVEPASVGIIDGLEPGAWVPLHSVMHFDIDLAQPALRDWLAQGLRDGWVHFSVASPIHTEVAGLTGFPRFLTKEAPAVINGLVAAPTLEATIIICEASADLDGDGVVDGNDLGALLAAWGTCGGPCAGDLNCDGVVDGADLGALLAAWTLR